MRGTVNFFDNAKGWGFITDENGKDHFVHYSSILIENGRKHLSEGDIVEFEVGNGATDREQAVNVQPILTLAMVTHELSKEELHPMRIIDDKGKHGWNVADKSDNPVVNDEMDLVGLAAYAGIDVEGLMKRKTIEDYKSILKDTMDTLEQSQMLCEGFKNI